MWLSTLRNFDRKLSGFIFDQFQHSFDQSCIETCGIPVNHFNTLSKTMVCRNCNRNVQDDTIYCPHCSTSTDPDLTTGEGSRVLATHGMSTEQRGLLVVGIMFVTIQLGSALWKWKVPHLYFREINLAIDIFWTNIPVLLALYSKGRARTVLLMAGMSLTLHFIITRFII